MPAQKVDIVTKIVPKSIGNPKAITGRADENDNAPHVLGLMGGTATKLVMRTMPNGDVFWGLGGTFVGVPFKREANGEYVPDTSKNRLSSGVMYLPPGIFETVAELLGNMQTGELKEGVSIEFMFKMQTVKATNPAGYSWSAVPLIETEAATDPMLAILEAAGYGGQEYLPAPDATSSAGIAGEAGPNGDDGAADGKGPDDGATNKVAAKAGKK